MIIPYNKTITKLLNSQIIGITNILQCILQSTKHTPSVKIIFHIFYCLVALKKKKVKGKLFLVNIKNMTYF